MSATSLAAARPLARQSAIAGKNVNTNAGAGGWETARSRLQWVCVMAIYRLIASGSFGPEEIEAMTAAYERALLELGMINRDDPLTELIAKAIVTVSASGERDPKAIVARALNALGIHRTAA